MPLIQPDNKYKLREAWKKWLSSLRPYAATTIHPNERLRRIGGGETANDRNIERIKRSMWYISQKLDEFYFSTPSLRDKISQNDRFDALCVVEKPGVSPHVHIAWFQRSELERRCDGNVESLGPNSSFSDVKRFCDQEFFEPLEKLNRLCVLLQCFNRSHLDMRDEDQLFLQSFREDKFRCAYPNPIPADTIHDWGRLGWSVHTRSIQDDGWSWYMSKELGPGEASSQVFWLSDAFGEGQRTKPTRYHTVDWKTGAKMLDLDKPLKART